MEKTMLSWIQEQIENTKRRILTKRAFAEIRNNGSEEELEEAVEQMMAAGGYENLDD